MMRHRRAVTTLGTLGLALGSLALVAPSAGATGTILHATPSAKLTNGQTVMVKGSGFTPGDHVYVLECLRTASGASGCDLSTLKPVVITAAGKLPATAFKVATGTIGNGTCGTTKANHAACAINAGNSSGGDSGTVPIFFLP